MAASSRAGTAHRHLVQAQNPCGQVATDFRSFDSLSDWVLLLMWHILQGFPSGPATQSCRTSSMQPHLLNISPLARRRQTQHSILDRARHAHLKACHPCVQQVVQLVQVDSQPDNVDAQQDIVELCHVRIVQECALSNLTLVHTDCGL